MRLIHQKSRCDRGIQGFHLTLHGDFEVLPGLVGDLFGQSVSFIADGVINVDNTFTVNNKDVPAIPRIGLRMQMPVDFTDLTYYGRGPWENYQDRKTSCFVGEYSCRVADMFEPYIRPQENSHRTDVIWFSLSDKKGKGLLVVADDKLEMNVSNYTDRKSVV